MSNGSHQPGKEQEMCSQGSVVYMCLSVQRLKSAAACAMCMGVYPVMHVLSQLGKQVGLSA